MRFFSGCGSKPWVPSTSASSLRELFRVPTKSWGYCGVRRGLLGLHWVWCNGGGPHLELRQEPQSSSAFMTSIAASLQRWNCRVRTHLALRNGTLLASRVVHEVTGHLSSCMWNLQNFPKMHGCAGPLLVPSSNGMHSKKCTGIGFLLIADREMGSFRMWHHPRGYISNFLVRQASS